MQHASQTFTFKFLYIPRASVEKKKIKSKNEGDCQGVDKVLQLVRLSVTVKI